MSTQRLPWKHWIDVMLLSSLENRESGSDNKWMKLILILFNRTWLDCRIAAAWLHKTWDIMQYRCQWKKITMKSMFLRRPHEILLQAMLNILRTFRRVTQLHSNGNHENLRWCFSLLCRISLIGRWQQIEINWIWYLFRSAACSLTNWCCTHS